MKSRLHWILPTKLLDKLRAEAAEQGLSIAALLITIVNKYFDGK